MTIVAPRWHCRRCENPFPTNYRPLTTAGLTCAPCRRTRRLLEDMAAEQFARERLNAVPLPDDASMAKKRADLLAAFDTFDATDNELTEKEFARWRPDVVTTRQVRRDLHAAGLTWKQLRARSKRT